MAGVDDDLVRQAHDGAVVFVDPLLDAAFRRIFVCVVELFEQGRNRWLNVCKLRA